MSGPEPQRLDFQAPASWPFQSTLDFVPIDITAMMEDYFDRHIERLIFGTSITGRLKDKDGNWVE